MSGLIASAIFNRCKARAQLPRLAARPNSASASGGFAPAERRIPFPQCHCRSAHQIRPAASCHTEAYRVPMPILRSEQRVAPPMHGSVAGLERSMAKAQSRVAGCDSRDALGDEFRISSDSSLSEAGGSSDEVDLQTSDLKLEGVVSERITAEQDEANDRRPE
jgi:hypothetical protein